MIKYKTDKVFGLIISHRLSDNWINASQFCQRQGTTFEEWMVSPVGSGFLKYFFETNEYERSDVIEKAHYSYFISPILLIGLGSSLSKTFEKNAKEWNDQNNAKAQAEKNIPIECVYLTSEGPDGNARISMTAFPIKGTHVQSEVDELTYSAGRDAYYNNYVLDLDIEWI